MSPINCLLLTLLITDHDEENQEWLMQDDVVDMALPGRRLEDVYPDPSAFWPQYNLSQDKKSGTLGRKLYNTAIKASIPRRIMDDIFSDVDSAVESSNIEYKEELLLRNCDKHGEACKERRCIDRKVKQISDKYLKKCGTKRAMDFYAESHSHRIKSVYLVKKICKCSQCLALANIDQRERAKNVKTTNNDDEGDDECCSVYKLVFSWWKFPLKKYPRHEFEVVSELHYFHLPDVLMEIAEVHRQVKCRNCHWKLPLRKRGDFSLIHCQRCKEPVIEMSLETVNQAEIDLSMDGIPGAKSNVSSTTCLALRIDICCPEWYPLGLLYRKKYSNTRMLSHRAALAHILWDFKNEGLNFGKMLMDSPERATIKGMTTVGGYCGCHICLATGLYDKKNKRICYPRSGLRGHPSDMFGEEELRTNEKSRALKMTANSKLNLSGKANEKKEYRLAQYGETDTSPLLLLGDSFDFLWDTPMCEMHLIDEGILKKTIESLALWFGEEEYYKFINHMLTNLKPPLSWARGCRSLCERSKYKAREFSMFTVCFPMSLITWFRGGEQELYITITVLLARYTDLTKAERDDLSIDSHNLFKRLCNCWSEIYENLPPGMVLVTSFSTVCNFYV